MKPVRLLSLFSGIGAFERALTLADVPYELVAYCEIDKYASKSYSLLHNVPESMNLGDITKVDIDSLPDFDMVVFGFPCQAISVIGKKQGLIKGSGTTSSLLWNVVDIIRVKKPIIAMFENVPNLLSDKMLPQFLEYLQEMNNIGYESAFSILNAKDYGVPQSRKRLFCISKRSDNKEWHE